MLIDNTEENIIIIYRRIGSTTYKVHIHFSDTTQETMNDKILRLIQRETQAGGVIQATMDVPQTSQPSEGSSL